MAETTAVPFVGLQPEFVEGGSDALVHGALFLLVRPTRRVRRRRDSISRGPRGAKPAAPGVRPLDTVSGPRTAVAPGWSGRPVTWSDGRRVTRSDERCVVRSVWRAVTRSDERASRGPWEGRHTLRRRRSVTEGGSPNVAA
ncbi:hypothetical protein GCM10009627_03340 [Curtobacterium herbarum]|uniref:Uncharacterized protein n=1 Tax=Curtobacterium herbarum TaxID=150122 RepID=A0ABP4K2P4_9MICO